MSTQSANPDDDLDIWHPPIYTDIGLSQFQNERGLIVYAPGCLNGKAYIQSDCFVDTYDVR